MSSLTITERNKVQMRWLPITHFAHGSLWYDRDSTMMTDTKNCKKTHVDDKSDNIYININTVLKTHKVIGELGRERTWNKLVLVHKNVLVRGLVIF